jgi:hypothetical protein
MPIVPDNEKNDRENNEAIPGMYLQECGCLQRIEID